MKAWLDKLYAAEVPAAPVNDLAGALGLPVWVLLCWDADWRWGEHDRHSHWYPQMRLLRQTTPGDWAPVVQTLVEDLRAWVQGR